jgi:WD40 repeat protein
VIFDAETGESVSEIPGYGILAVSPDGRRVAVRDGSLSVRIVDTVDRMKSTVIALSSFPWVADFSPDGEQLAIADGTRVVVSDAQSGDMTHMLRMENGGVIGVEFWPSGELVTAAADGAIITWDIGDWSEDFRTQRFHRPMPMYEQDERTFVSDPFDGKTEVVIAEPAAWEARACQVAGRVLSGQEWEELFGDRAYTPACSG